MPSFIKAFLNKVAHPVFDCEDCIGMVQHGCYCSATNASSPGMPPTKVQRLALWMLREKTSA